MRMDGYLSEEQVCELIEKVRANDNAAWERLCENFDRYVHECCWKRLRKMDLSDAYKKDLAEDLYMAGWQGFVSAVRNYDPEKGKFLTYATWYIDGEISKELNLLFNPLGLTNRPKGTKAKGESIPVQKVSLEDYQGAKGGDLIRDSKLSVPEDVPVQEKYGAERRTLQLLEILKMLTDENTSITKEELMDKLRVYRIAKYDNGAPLESANTITSTLESILLELNPLEYNENNDKDYRVKYDGYQEDRLKQKLNKGNAGKAPAITGFSYVHTFSNSELDQLIQQISFSDMLSLEDKTKLIGKLVGTASVNYRTPFWNGEKLKFDPKAIHGRFSGRVLKDRALFAENIKVIQYAMNNLGQIRFMFNRYTDDKRMVPASEYIHTLSPYHLVVYHDNFYCIGLKAKDKRIWHYRVDLMSDVEIVKDEDGKMIPMEVSSFEGLPIFNAYWDPEKYMAEHLNMGFDEPQNIQMKIRNIDYTMIHDWFGDHYEKVREIIEKDDDGREVAYDIVQVRTSPAMIVHWAMQYGTKVEILNEEIRGRIKEELKKMTEMYS
ncbi:MAG: WYL domain-containing protein [Lachnospiraceae bacterium]|jgi:hypothetical protein|nr:WYL domain-containing protein [Lachnospiraceae bacterium]